MSKSLRFVRSVMSFWFIVADVETEDADVGDTIGVFLTLKLPYCFLQIF